MQGVEESQEEEQHAAGVADEREVGPTARVVLQREGGRGRRGRREGGKGGRRGREGKEGREGGRGGR